MAMDKSIRTQRFVPVDIYSSGYRVVGKIMVANAGAIGIMNDSTNSTLEVHDARLAKVHMPTKLVDHFDLVRMDKKRIVAICLSRIEDLGPRSLTRGGFGSTAEYPVFITTQVYEVEGTLELTGRFDYQGLMHEGTREFIVAYDATLTAILIPNVRVESPAILVNRNHADIVALLSQRTKEEN